MADTTFSNGTVIVPAWLNDVNRYIYDHLWSNQPINAKDAPYNATGNGSTDDTAALQSAINAAASGLRRLYIPKGTYQVNSLSIPANTYIYGDGIDKTILRQISGANDAMHVADPGSSSAFTSNIVLLDFTLKGTVATDGFQEVLHLLFTQGASDVHIERVKFSGFRGDGFYVGTGNERGQNPTQVRHNKNVHVLDCYFDGETKNNRNGISIIDCDSMWVERCYFTRMSKFDMPGCIDLEPDSGGTPNGSTSVIRNINILNNKFYDNAGQSAGVAINFPIALSSYTTLMSGINIHGNEVDNTPTASTATYGYGLMINGLFNITRAIPSLGIVFSENKVTNVYRPWLVKGARGVRFSLNTFKVSRASGEVGDSTNTIFTYDVDFDQNTFYALGSDNTLGGTGIFLYSAWDGVSFTKNFFDSCGFANNTYNANISKSTAGTGFNLTVEDNTFYSPVANANSWDVRIDAGTLSAGTTRHARNRKINVNGGPMGVYNDYIVTQDWQVPSFVNSWVDFGGTSPPVGFMKDAAGRVYLRGSVKNGTTTAGLTILKIPAGYRPGSRLPFIVWGDNAGTKFPAYLEIEQTIGDLVISVNLAGNTQISLNQINWMAEA